MHRHYHDEPGSALPRATPAFSVLAHMLILVVDQLPGTATGKVRRLALRDRLAGGGEACQKGTGHDLRTSCRDSRAR